MKKILAIVLSVVFALSICACGKEVKDQKSDAILQAEEAINKIGEVTLDSENDIKNAEKYYNILTDNEKSQVSNRMDLVDAREKYDELAKAEALSNAKSAYEKLNKVAQLCIDGMDDVYGAWHFGIYDADDYSSSVVALALSLETSFTSTEITQACADAGFSVSYLSSRFDYCLWAIDQAHENRGTYAEIHSLLNDAESLLQKLSGNTSNSEYHAKLTEYYAKVASYAEFFENTTGSFSQLSSTINDYENTIRTLQSDLNILLK